MADVHGSRSGRVDPPSRLHAPPPPHAGGPPGPQQIDPAGVGPEVYWGQTDIRRCHFLSSNPLFQPLYPWLERRFHSYGVWC